MEYISLLVLIAAIVCACLTGINAGIIGMGLAYVFGKVCIGLTEKQIISGFPISIVVTLMGMMLLFGIARENGTLNKIASSIIKLACGKAFIIPIIFYVLCAVLAALGPGPVVMCAVIAPIAMAVGKKQGIPDVLMAVPVWTGCISGGLSRISVSGVIACSLGKEQGVENYTPIFLSCIVIGALLFILFFSILGGFRYIKGIAVPSSQEDAGFTKDQVITLIDVLVVVFAVIFLKTDTGLTAFIGGVVLLLLHVVDQQKAIGRISWSTIMLIVGMGMLINVVKLSGGIDAITTGLASIMHKNTAAPIMCIIAGLMSSVSSASGVVMPTLIPTIGELTVQMGNSVTAGELLSGIIIGAHVVTASPLSTLGALCLASANNETDKQKMFTQLLSIGFGSVFIAAILGGVGLFRL